MSGIRPRLAPCLVIVAACVASASAQPRRLSLDAIFGPQGRVDFDGDLPDGLTWIDDDHYVERTASGDPPLVRVDAVTGEAVPLFDADRMEAALARLPGISRTAARRLSRQSRHVMNRTYTSAIIDYDNDLYYYAFGTDRAVRLTNDPADEVEVAFSPNGEIVSFVRDHDLFVVDVSQGRELVLTTDGEDRVRNGVLDWVYQEEIYGRGNFRGYWWSPDSTRMAYLHLDDTQVPVYPVVDHVPYHPVVEHWEYPKAGDPNPAARLGVVESAGGDTVWVDLNVPASTQPLIVRVGWSPDGAQVVVQVQDREQTWLELQMVDPQAGTATTVLRETSDAWVNVAESPIWLADGSFLWLSERSGWQHIYHYEADGRLRRQVTDGAWEVRELHGVGHDVDGTWVYFSGTRRSPIGHDVYRVRLDGTELTRVTALPGTHYALFNPSLTRFLDTSSTLTTPPRLDLRASGGAPLRVIAANEPTVLQQYALSDPEFMQVPNRDGFMMEGLLIKPADFDPSRTYPVYQHVYGGPHIQRVRDAWIGATYLFWQLLAQEGFVVWVLDNSTASGKGAVSTWPVYQNFGEQELRDLEDGLDWLQRQGFVDADRIGIEGWSYGGYMVCYALTHSQRFAMGIAGAPVTDWRDYDTIYTERYMRHPDHNPQGYARSAPRFAAANLAGALLLVHGTMDENVHLQHTLQFAYALQQAGKPFDMMIYPKSRHRLGGLDQEKHRHLLMLEFAKEHLQPGAPGSRLSADQP